MRKVSILALGLTSLGASIFVSPASALPKSECNAILVACWKKADVVGPTRSADMDKCEPIFYTCLEAYGPAQQPPNRGQSYPGGNSQPANHADPAGPSTKAGSGKTIGPTPPNASTTNSLAGSAIGAAGGAAIQKSTNGSTLHKVQ